MKWKGEEGATKILKWRKGDYLKRRGVKNLGRKGMECSREGKKVKMKLKEEPQSVKEKGGEGIRSLGHSREWSKREEST